MDSAKTTIATTTDTDRELSALLAQELTKLAPTLAREGTQARLIAVHDATAHIIFADHEEGCGGMSGYMKGGLRLMLLEKVTGLKEVIFE